MSEQVKHTPLPWKIREFPHTHTEKENEIANVRGIIILGGYSATACRDDAEHIVKCVNSHEILVKALEEILNARKIPSEYLGHICSECGEVHDPEYEQFPHVKADYYWKIAQKALERVK